VTFKEIFFGIPASSANMGLPDQQSSKEMMKNKNGECVLVQTWLQLN
jgi:hypothetical protein